MENPVVEPISRLTRDLIAEILSRVPYKSLCICKCVCPAWRDLIADPVYRKKILQSLAGFFYRINDEAAAEPRGFPGVNYADLSAFPWASVPRTHPRLPLPPDSTDRVMSVDDSCDGLFLARISIGAGNFRYMVSNPASGEYTLLPHNGHAGTNSIAYLGFDSGASTQEFHVFEFLHEWSHRNWGSNKSLFVRAVRIYSSKTGAWVAMEPQWDIEVGLCFDQPGVFCNGCLHLLTYQSGLAIVDAQGVKWRTVLLPILAAKGFSGFIGKSAGQLLYIDPRDSQGYSSNRSLTISVYVLSVEIYNWEVSHLDDECVYWNMLHKFSNAVPKKKFLKVIGVHPHANLIVMAYSNSELLAYDLDHRESTIVYHLDHDYRTFMQFFPYVPLLSCLPLDGGIRLATPN
ncbi:putative F-box protein At3g16210 [Triticum urartu]|nr:putative F-box protein At3g16210 [Triticum urartu]